MHSLLRTRSASFLLALLSLGMVAHVSAAPLVPKVSKLESYKDFLFGIDEVRKNIDAVQCGGWEDTGAGVSGGSIPVPTITGVPGRGYEPLDEPITGLGVRKAFEYPTEDTTTGYKTACDVKDDTIINPEKLCLISNGTATPEQCKKLYERLTIDLPQMVIDGAFSSNDPKVTCNTSTILPPTTYTHYCFTYTSECKGAECQTVNPPVFRCASPSTVPITYQSSFYRQYDTKVRTPDGQPWDIESICYGQYKEKDPKTTVMKQEDEQCEIVLDGDTPPTREKYPEWEPGSKSQKGTVKASEETVREPASPERLVPEPWMADKDTNITIIDYASWEKKQKDAGVVPRLSDLLSMPMETKSTASKTTSKNSKTDAFDDTAERDIAKFWEEEQRTLLTLTRSPQITLILPSLFLHNLSEDDPLFQVLGSGTSLPTGLVQVSLRAGHEDLGRVLQSFAESRIFRLHEVRIPILVPIAGEVDSRIAHWEQWKEHEQKAADEAMRESYAGAADEIIAKLHSYKKRIEQVRILRGSVVLYTQKLLERDREIRETIAEWYKLNTEKIADLEATFESQRGLQRIWRRVQRSLLIADECQLLWCSNQRYSAPIYSLLDAWWGKDEPGPNRNLSFAPESITSLGIIVPEDLLYDFSSFSFLEKALPLPVFDPVQVRLNLPLPPYIGEKPAPASTYPDLPELPTDEEFIGISIPDVDMDDLPEVTLPEIVGLDQAKDLLREFRIIIDGTPIAEQKDQEEADKNGEIPDDIPGINHSRDSFVGSMCRFPFSVTQARLDAEHSNPSTLVHIENDLRERIGRLFSRWMPNRTEDFAGRVERVQTEGVASAGGCHEGLFCIFLPKVTQQKNSYLWIVPSTSLNAEVLIQLMRDRSLPASKEENPYLFAPLDILERIFPKTDILQKISLPPR